MPNQRVPAVAPWVAAGQFRIALGVEYKGSNYHGFQLQEAGTPSIQGHLEEALQKINAGLPVRLSCAGRTDAMVHACGQVVHFDTSIERSMRAWMMELTVNLLKISVWSGRKPCRRFHSRFFVRLRGVIAM